MSSLIPIEYVNARGTACLSCRRKKQKCPAEKPTCSACVKANLECVYNEPPRSRAQLLVDRIQELENRLAQLNGSQDTPSQGRSSSDSSGASSSRQPSSPGVASPLTRSSSSQSRRPLGVNMNWTYDPASTGQVVAQVQTLAISTGLKQNLINIFIQNRDKCYFDLHPGRFMEQLAKPVDSPEAPLPALVDAILLVGCYFSRSPSVSAYEPSFLDSALQGLSLAFTQADRLHDFVRASNLITFYYLSKGMHSDAYRQVISSAHMSVSLRMHQINSAVWRPGSPPDENPPILPHPRDGVELGERILTFWQTFSLDKIAALAVGQRAHLTGAPGVDPLLRITTPFPRLLLDYQTGNVSDMEHGSVSALYTGRGPSGNRNETLTSLRVQGLALVYHATSLIESNVIGLEELSTAADSAIQNFAARLPSIHASGECGEIPPTPGLSPVNHHIVMLHTLAYVSSIVLHQYGVDDRDRRRCANAMIGITTVIGQLPDTLYSDLFIGIGHLWFIAGRILMNISHNTQDKAYHQAAQVVMRALKRLSIVYPPLGFHLQQLQLMQ